MLKTKFIKTDISFGEAIFNSVPEKIRPGWGTALLMRFDSHLQIIPPEVEELYKMIDIDNDLIKAKSQFEKIRHFYLSNKNYKPESYLILAEKVAKVAYNTTNPLYPFDLDSGWYIPTLAIQTAEYFKDENLIKDIKQALLLYYKSDNSLKKHQ